MIRVLSTCLPIILMIFTGMILRRYKILTRDGIDALKKTALNITLPALMFSAFAEIVYTYKNIIIIALMVSVCFLGVLLGKLLKRLMRIGSPFMPYVTTTFELGMIGYALYATLYPGESLGSLAGMDIGLTLFANTVYRVFINKANGNGHLSGRQIAAETFRSPVVIGIIAGIFIGATGLYQAMIPSGAASVLDACTNFFGAPTAAIILLTIGYDLVLSDVPWKSVCETLAARIAIMAVLRIGMGMLFRLLGLYGYDHALNVLFILPTAFILPVLARDENESAYIASCLSVNTVFTIAAFVVLAIIG